MKSFWRKPREEGNSPTNPKLSSNSTTLRYRYDRIESQILFLADLSFMIHDYETAGSMYRLVRDDYKSDKSNLHLAHTIIMSAFCYFIAEPNRVRDIQSLFESLTQLLAATAEVCTLTFY